VITAVGRRHVECTAEVWEEDRLILKSRIGLVRVRGNRAVAIDDRTAM
jgi:hypothetical protein